MTLRPLIIEGARQNNLKNVNLTLPHNTLIVVTGLSGSGKSSLAFDTLFAEGQWRFIESLSAYARVFIEKLNRPDVDGIYNIRPAIALEQVNSVKTARSTVGTSTESYDFLRLLFSKISQPCCLKCGRELRSWNPSMIVDDLLTHYSNEKALIIFISSEAPDELKRRGFHRVRTREDSDSGDKYLVEVILDRLVIRSPQRLADSIDLAWLEGRGKIVIDIVDKKRIVYSSGLTCDECSFEVPQPHPLLFSFNHPTGACPVCKGFGNTLHYREERLIPDKNLSLKDGAIEPWGKPSYTWWNEQLIKGAEDSDIDVTTAYKDLSKEARELVFSGNEHFLGICDFFDALQEKKYKLHVRVFLSKYRTAMPCEHCRGSRLKPEVLAYRIGGKTIHELAQMSITSLRSFLKYVELSDHDRAMSEEIQRQLELKLSFLERVGLGYLTLDRLAKTLSGGESQRIKLANQLASRLTGTLYILDEPTIGLHPSDVSTIIDIMKELSQMGNTLVVVEHENSVISSADWIVEVGPGSGAEGGEIVFSGKKTDFENARTLTAQYLRKEQFIPRKKCMRRGRKMLSIKGTSGHNLKHVDMSFPLQAMVCVTGLSGSGKSTLVKDTLFKALALKFGQSFDKPLPYESIAGAEHLNGVSLMDQAPIGKSLRSNPVTYIKAFDGIRKFFSILPDARLSGFTSSHFSFNTHDGRCPVCKGEGYQKLEMYFFEDIYIKCEECGGKRYKKELLSVMYEGKSIYDILEMTVNEAIEFLSHIPQTVNRLRLLQSVGLGYIKLGQPMTTLSGGEAQRLKICAELGVASRKKYLYILDEPTVGLHTHDVKKLLQVLDRLIEADNSVLIVEHNLDVIWHSDWIIDLGPGGGEQGGHIVATGTPEMVSNCPDSLTGQFLKENKMN